MSCWRAPVTSGPFAAQTTLISVRTPKSVEVDARLDGEPGAGHQPALVVRFVIVQVRAVAVHGFAEAVAGAMHDVRRRNRPLDRPARAARSSSKPRTCAAGARRILEQSDGGVARVADGGESVGHFARAPACPVNPTHVMSAKTAPGVSSLPHRSSSRSSSSRIDAVASPPGQIVRDCRRSPAPTRSAPSR